MFTVVQFGYIWSFCSGKFGKHGVISGKHLSAKGELSQRFPKFETIWDWHSFNNQHPLKNKQKMENRIFFLLTFLLISSPLLLKAGDPIEVDPFHSIIVSSEINAEIGKSEQERIEPAFKNAEEENLIVEVVDSVLKIRMKTGNYKSADLKVKISYIHSPRRLEAHGRAQIWSSEEIHPANTLSVQLDNGGEIRLSMDCDSLSATVSQGSVIHLKGKSRALRVKVSTNGTFSGYEFNSEIAEITANSTGKAKVSVSKYLKANASSKGFIGYVGEPGKVDEKTSLKGEILKTVLE